MDFVVACVVAHEAILSSGCKVMHRLNPRVVTSHAMRGHLAPLQKNYPLAGGQSGALAQLLEVVRDRERQRGRI